MLGKTNSDTLIKQSTSSFSIDSLLSKSKDSLDSFLNNGRSVAGLDSLSVNQNHPILHPHLMFPQLVQPHPNPAQLLQRQNTNDGSMPTNLPFDLIARSYMSGILGRFQYYTYIKTKDSEDVFVAALG